jgi:hypothetical protein
MSDAEHFDWCILDEAIVLTPRRGLAVYLNEAGDVVIREQGSWPDDDVWIVIALADVPTVARRLIEVINEHAAPMLAPAAIEPAKHRPGGSAAPGQEAPELPLVRQAAQ